MAPPTTYAASSTSCAIGSPTRPAWCSRPRCAWSASPSRSERARVSPTRSGERTTTRPIDPRIRQRRIEVARRAGRRRLRWVVGAGAAVVVVAVAIALLHTPWFSARLGDRRRLPSPHQHGSDPLGRRTRGPPSPDLDRPRRGRRPGRGAAVRRDGDGGAALARPGGGDGCRAGAGRPDGRTRRRSGRSSTGTGAPSRRRSVRAPGLPVLIVHAASGPGAARSGRRLAAAGCRARRGGEQHSAGRLRRAGGVGDRRAGRDGLARVRARGSPCCSAPRPTSTRSTRTSPPSSPTRPCRGPRRSTSPSPSRRRSPADRCTAAWRDRDTGASAVCPEGVPRA